MNSNFFSELDFALVLVCLVAATGSVWLIDILFFAKKRQETHVINLKKKLDEGEAPDFDEPWLVGFSKSLFPVFVIVLILRSFIIEPFRIPSNSMMPTLLTGDYIVVNKFAYGFRLPVLNTKILDLGSPQRGDVIVFRYPENPAQNFIKRVVGIPGDKVTYYNKILRINDKIVPQEDIGLYDGYGSGSMMTGAMQRKETLGTVEHNILMLDQGFDNRFIYQEVVVQAGQYFVLGDNRDRSKDSRYWGIVPDENLVGRAFMIWMNWDPKDGLSWNRIGQSIQ